MAKLIYISNLRLPTEKAYGIQIANMCEAFAFCGLDVLLTFPYRHNNVSGDIFEYYGVQKNFKIHTFNAPDFYWPGVLDQIAVAIKNTISAIKLVKIALKDSYELFYSRDELPLFVLSFFRKNIVFEAHKFSDKRMIFYKRFKKAGVNIVTISKGIKDNFMDMGFESDKIMIASDGVNIEKFNISLTKEEARKELGLPLEGALVGYVGSFTTMGMHKGLDCLFEALRRINDEIKLVLVGSSVNLSDVQYYKDLALTLGIKNRVIFLGKVEHVRIPLYLKAFDILSMPYPSTTHYAYYMSPLKLFEYMASGRPIISSDLPSIREVLNDSNAILVEPDNAENLARGLNVVINDPEKGRIIAERALEDVKKYTWQQRAEHVITWYASGSKT